MIYVGGVITYKEVKHLTKNSTKAEREEMEVYCCKVLIILMK